MVKKINLFLAFICFFIASCNISKKSIQTDNEEQITLSKTKWSEKQALHFNLWQILESYTHIYFRCPRNVEDLMIFIERSNDDYRMINNNVYRFLNENKNNLIFDISADSTTTIYNGKMKPNRILIKADYVQACENINLAQVNFFDEQGYWFRVDRLTDIVTERLKTEYWRLLQETKDRRGFGVAYNRTILDYTPDRLKDLCNNKILNIEESKFLQNTFNFLDSLASDHKISRITVPSFIDN